MKRLFARLFLSSLMLGLPAIVAPSAFPSYIAQAQEQQTAAVLDLSPKGNVSASEASILTDRIRSLLVKSRLFRVMERESMDKVLKEQGFSSTQICESADCTLQIGRLLSVRRILTGSVSKLGSIYSINLRVIDVEQGTILEEEFTDCNCSLETLLVEKIPQIVDRVLKTNVQPQTNNSSQNPSDTDAERIRKVRPWLISAEGGYGNIAGLSFMYNLNEFFALRLGGGYGLTTYNQVLGNTFITSLTPQPHINGAIRAYFNQHQLAGFLETAVSSNAWFTPRIGIEYRQSNGLTLTAAAGWAFSLGITHSIFDVIGGIGYAF
jgi:TolB-like protein